MEHIINQLVELDSAGQAMVQQAQEARAAEEARMAEYKLQMYREYLEKQKSRVEQFRQFEAQELETQLQALAKVHAERTARLRAMFEQNADEWIAGMVRRCIGG